MNRKYNLRHFIVRFRIIPDAYWYVGALQNPDHQDQKSALGHCTSDDEAINLRILCSQYDLPIDKVNDGTIKDSRITKNSPKERVLQALEWIKEIQSEKINFY